MMEGGMTTFEDACRSIVDAARDGKTSLNLFDLESTSLPAEICQMSRLKTLVLHRGSLTHLPESLEGLHQLETVHVIHHDLCEFPLVLTRLRNLRTIWLGWGTILRAFPRDIESLQRLEYLDMVSNCIWQLPAEITDLKSLKHLILSLNPLSQLPSRLDDLNSLEVLRLDRVPLETLPISVARTPKLKLLTLNECPAVPRDLRQFFSQMSIHKLKGTQALKHRLLGESDPHDRLFRDVSSFLLPEDLFSCSER